MGFWDFLNFDNIPNDDTPITPFQYMMATLFFTVCLISIVVGGHLLNRGRNPAPNDKNAKKD